MLFDFLPVGKSTQEFLFGPLLCESLILVHFPLTSSSSPPPPPPPPLPTSSLSSCFMVQEICASCINAGNYDVWNEDKTLGFMEKANYGPLSMKSQGLKHCCSF